MMGSTPEGTQPVTWVRTFHGGRVFYTSLGAPGDFEEPSFRRLLTNAIFWAAGREAVARGDHGRSQAAGQALTKHSRRGSDRVVIDENRPDAGHFHPRGMAVGAASFPEFVRPRQPGGIDFDRIVTNMVSIEGTGVPGRKPGPGA